jgi:environmental stress-induced protein Ves
MPWHLIALADLAPSPWKNGGGVTRELLTWPDGPNWVWRLSVAELERSGEFSCFDGVQRSLLLLSGSGIVLELGQGEKRRSHRLNSAAQALCFAGETPAFCHLTDGPALAFNLMWRRDLASAEIRRVHAGHSLVLEQPKTLALYALSERLDVQLDDESLSLPPHTLAWRQCPSGCTVEVSAAPALWIEISG